MNADKPLLEEGMRTNRAFTHRVKAQIFASAKADCSTVQMEGSVQQATAVIGDFFCKAGALGNPIFSDGFRPITLL